MNSGQFKWFGVKKKIELVSYGKLLNRNHLLKHVNLRIVLFKITLFKSLRCYKYLKHLQLSQSSSYLENEYYQKFQLQKGLKF